MGGYLALINISPGEWEILSGFGVIFPFWDGWFLRFFRAGFWWADDGRRWTSGLGGKQFVFENAVCICFLFGVRVTRTRFPSFLKLRRRIVRWWELKRAVGAKWLMELGLGGMRNILKVCD